MKSENRSTLHLRLRGISISVKIRSPLSRKNRRAALLMLFRSAKEGLRELKLNEIYHSEEPFKTKLNTMLRGTVGNDALSRSSDQQSLGYAMRIFRTKFELTQQELADYLGVTQALISGIEHGKRKPNQKIREFIENSITSPSMLHPGFLPSREDRGRGEESFVTGFRN